MAKREVTEDVNNLSSIIKDAKERVPNAFATDLGNSTRPPVHPRGRYVQPLNPVVDFKKINSNIDYLREENQFDIEGEKEKGFDIEGKKEKGMRTKVLKEIEKEGAEALGWYCSFHKFNESTWGIYLHAENITGLALELAANHLLGEPFPKRWYNELVNKFSHIISKKVYWHEFFHFKVDLFSLNRESLSGSPCYTIYHDNVYAKTKYTKEWNEEIFANNTAYEKMKDEKYKREAIRELKDLVGPDTAYATRASKVWKDRQKAEALVEEIFKESGYSQVRRFLKRTDEKKSKSTASNWELDPIKKMMKDSPAGYRDWELGYDDELKELFCNQVLAGAKNPPKPFHPVKDTLFKADGYYENYIGEVPLFTEEGSVLSDILFAIPKLNKTRKALKHLGFQRVPSKRGHEKYKPIGKPNLKKIKRCLHLKDNNSVEAALSQRGGQVILSDSCQEKMGVFLGGVVKQAGVKKEQFQCLTK